MEKPEEQATGGLWEIKVEVDKEAVSARVGIRETVREQESGGLRDRERSKTLHDAQEGPGKFPKVRE